MKKRNIQLSFLLILLAVIAGVSFSLISQWAFPSSTHPLDKGDRILLTPNEKIHQKFTAQRNGLKQIEILMNKLKLNRSDTLLLQISEADCKTVLHEKIVKSGSIDSQHPYTLRFPLIARSKNKTYCLVTSFRSEKVFSKTRIPRLYTGPSDSPGYERSLSDHEIYELDEPIAFRPGYRNISWSKNISELNERISQYKPWFLKHHHLSIIIIFTLVLSISMVGLLIRL